MIEWMTGRLGLLALAATGVAGLLVVNAVENRRLAEAMLDGARDARAEAQSLCEARWAAEIEKSNAMVERARAEQARAAIELEARASDEIAALRKSLFDMETKNASLPGAGACGLDRERVRLLPQ